MTAHDTIPKRKRLIGQFHLIYVKTRFGGGFFFWGGRKMNR
ncbi:hypothetical protein IAM_13295 [Escherichia coli XH001]|nr:hypothetical protein IAM_13295 [Escherichia coli XH001]